MYEVSYSTHMSPANNNSGCSNGGRGCQSGHGQGCNCQNGQTKSNQSTTQASSKKFKGACDELKGHVFDCSDYKQANRFSMMLKKLTEHIGVTYKNGGNIHASIVAETKSTVPVLPALTVQDAANITTAEEVQLHIFDKKLDGLDKCKELLDSNI